VEVDLIDTTFNPSLDYVSSMLEKGGPDIVGIYSATLMHEDALKVAKIAKSHGAYVVMGGPHPSISPETVINEKHVDAICIGEGEETFSEFIQTFDMGKEFNGIEGIWYKKSGRSVKNSFRKPIKDLDELPFPDMDIFDVETYVKNFIQLDSYSPNLRGLSVIVSRGCPFGCSYCQPTLERVLGKRFRIRSPRNVVKEMKKLKKEYQLDGFYFQDDTLTVIKPWIMEFCDLLISDNMNIVWACNSRADVIDKEMLQRMRKAGLVKMKVGIESISDRIRNGIYRKGVSIAQIDQLIKNVKDLDIQLAGFFMIGAPTETKVEVFETIKFAARSDLQEANFSVTVPLPSTNLYKLAQINNWNLPQKFSDYDYYHAVRPPISNLDMSSRKLQIYKKIAYLYFYLHPKRIRNTLKTVWGVTGFRKTIQKLKRF
jgi:radical SAM superfamily enzyme YgiQ (UPF0313 family)